MTEPSKKTFRKKGGARFPRYKLDDALAWSKKLVSKTHVGPQPASIIFSGVVDARGSTAEIRVSTLKQYGLMEGPSTAYIATSLAKKIESAPADERPGLLVQAVLTPPVFKGVYDAYHGDTVAKSKLKQRVADLKVHPDEAENCVEIYLSSLASAGLLRVTGESVEHSANHQVAQPANEVVESSDADQLEHDGAIEPNEIDDDRPPPSGRMKGRAGINVTISIDSSLDTDKLERQLALLRKYGAL